MMMVLVSTRQAGTWHWVLKESSRAVTHGTDRTALCPLLDVELFDVVE